MVDTNFLSPYGGWGLDTLHTLEKLRAEVNRFANNKETVFYLCAQLCWMLVDNIKYKENMKALKLLIRWLKTRKRKVIIKQAVIPYNKARRIHEEETKSD